MTGELLVIVPSRGRPQAVERVADAWRSTDAHLHAALLFAVDADDPELPAYHAVQTGDSWLKMTVLPEWQPMVHKLDNVALTVAEGTEAPFALGFAGDDHLPRTSGWAVRYLAALRELGTGIVYGDDLIQGEQLPTQWAMTADIVRALGRMVPAPVGHLFCDNSVADLGREADCLRYLPDVVIEHRHPVAGRTPWDDSYRRVNSVPQWTADHDGYQRWHAERLATDAKLVRALRLTATPPPAT